jgi:Trypsin-like peptidase domain
MPTTTFAYRSRRLAVRLRALFSILLAISFVLVLVENAQARRAIPDDNLAYPVSITLKTAKLTSRGSGIYLNTDNAMYLVTAKHVLAAGLDLDPETQKVPDAQVELLSYSKEPLNPTKIWITVNLQTLRASGDVKAHQSQDVVVVKLATADSPVQSGGHRNVSYLPGVTERQQSAEAGPVGATLDGIKTFDQVLVGNEAIIYGYPVSLGLPANPQFDPLRPLLRKALIAGQDPQKRSIIIDGPAYKGNSGGPVFEIELDGFNIVFGL